jgi:hypothetical protein
MAIRTQTLSLEDWGRMIHGEPILASESKDKIDVNKFLAEKILKPCYETTIVAQQGIFSLIRDDPEPSVGILELALNRWRQMQSFLEKVVQNSLEEPLKRDLMQYFDRRRGSLNFSTRVPL